MNYKRESLPNFRYSLHDASLIEIKLQGQDLILKTDYGFVDIEKKSAGGRRYNFTRNFP